MAEKDNQPEGAFHNSNGGEEKEKELFKENVSGSKGKRRYGYSCSLALPKKDAKKIK